MKTAKEVISRIAKGGWEKEVATRLYPFISKMRTPPSFAIRTELTVRIPTEELTRYKKPKPQRRRFDILALVRPHYKAWGPEIFSVGMEVKVSKSDLLRDTKIPDYLGYTDLFFIVVPDALAFEALNVASCSEFIGVISVNRSRVKVHKYPDRQSVPDQNRAEVYQEFIIKKLKS